MIAGYRTVLKKCGPVEIKEKGSKFISFIYHVKDPDEAEDLVKDLRKQYHDATHVCYAYVTGFGKNERFRFNDDGEPSKTAGYPIYLEIKKLEITDVLVCSVRYFGGTKLGTGGLARMYSASAKAVLENVEVSEITLKKNVRAEVPFDLTGMMIKHIEGWKGTETTNLDYNETGAVIEIRVPVDTVESFIFSAVEKSGGKVKIVS
jgi:uncharacterized YigZ family protein